MDWLRGVDEIEVGVRFVSGEQRLAVLNLMYLVWRSFPNHRLKGQYIICIGSSAQV
jgi:hypothetical protein